MKKSNKLLISACLLGIPCQYDGKVANRLLLKGIINEMKGAFIPICPEQLSGLPTPRPPVELVNGDGFDVLKGKARVVTKSLQDLSLQFIHGAEICLYIAQITGCSQMITQKRSPSCSCSQVYDGSFSHRLIEGCGVASAKLQLFGISTVDIDLFEEYWRK